MYEIRTTQEFDDWLDNLRNRTAVLRIAARIDRLEQGNFGDTKSITNEISELRLFFGSGYRIYYSPIFLEKIMKTSTKKFDVSKYLDSPEAIKEYLEIMLDENGIEGFQRALGHVAKAHGMTEIAKKANVGRESLYKSLSETGKPRLDTIYNVLQALGLQLSIKVPC